MQKRYFTEFAVCSDGRCDLTDLPCLRALNLARQMAGASASLGDALPEAFGLEADVEIADCLRPCRLSIAVDGPSVAVSREGFPLASVHLPMASLEHGRSGALPFAAANWRAH